MPRALTLQRTIVPAADRKTFLKRLRERSDYYKRANCNFWVFEEEALPGAFLEFTEAPDAKTLATAHAAAPGAVMDPARIYREVELK